MKEHLQRYKQYLLTGVSHVIPFIASGGILMALAIAFAPMTAQGPNFDSSPVLKLIVDIGNSAFTLLLPVLAGYIAYARAGKPALVAGMLGGQISSRIHAGFLGALVAGLLAGWVVDLLKKMPVPKSLKPLMPILIIPIFSALIIGALMFEVVGVPIANLMVFLAEWLKTMGTANAVVLGALLGAMIAFDMGGPINKTAFFFGSAMIAALVIGLLNTIIRPILVILTLPVTIITVGLFLLVVNGLMFWMASGILGGFHVTGFWAAMLGALIYSVLGLLIDRLVAQLFPE